MKLSWILAGVFFVTTLLLAALLIASWAENKSANTELEKTRTELQKSQIELEEMETILREKNDEIHEQKDQIDDLGKIVDDKNQEIEDLEQELNQSQEDLEKTINILSEAKDEIEEIREETKKIGEDINQSIQWFTENSELPDLYKADRYENKVRKGCENKGVLNLACVSFLMEEELGITYKTDPGDKLYSLAEIIDRKGGDCEDYSLFFKATVKDYEVFEAWEEGGGTYNIYEDEEQVWYYDDAHGVLIEGRNAYPVCYYYGSSGGVLLGHCVVMFTKRTISSADDISTENLLGSKLVEPQSGRYVGEIGEKFTVCSEGICDEPYAIAFIITDNDLYHFDQKWDYYHEQKEKVEEILASLDFLAEWPEIPS